MSTGPALSYTDLVTALDGRHALRAWLALADVLQRRGGWRFTVNPEGLIFWERHDRRRRWIAAETRQRRSRFVVWQGGRRRDDVTWWHCPTVGTLEQLLDALEHRRRPPLAAAGVIRPCTCAHCAALPRVLEA